MIFLFRLSQEKKLSLFFVFTSMMIFLGCDVNRNSDKISSNGIQSKKISSVKHAIGFDIVHTDRCQILSIYRHYNKTVDTLMYLLHETDAEIPSSYRHLPSIEIPVENIAILQSSFISYFDFSKSIDRIKAISEVRYVYDSRILKAVKNNLIKEVGYGDNLDKEQLLELDINLVIDSGWPNSDSKISHSLATLGIPIIQFSEWQEITLLGRSEWAKVIGVLTQKGELVNQKFDIVEAEYNYFSGLVKNCDNYPTVICNLPYKGTWYVPGGNSYVSNMIRDAGGKYMWSANPNTGALPFDFETVYASGIDADYWINTDYTNSIKEIMQVDKRFTQFKSIQTGLVFNPVNKISGLANDYWESGMMNPHLILADLIKVLHPEILPEHQFIYYKKLQ